MKIYNIKNAFGEAPQSFRDQVNQMIDELEDKPMKRRYKITTLLAAALIVALAGTAAVAAIEGNLKKMFANQELKIQNDAIDPGIQSVSASYKGDAVRCTMQEGLYDDEGGTYALSWEWENLTGEEELYVVCDTTEFGGKLGDWRGYTYVTEFFLPQGITMGGLLGNLPEGVENANECELRFSVLRPIGPYNMEGDGYIAVDERYIRDADMSYSDALVAQGNFEIADRFSLSFTLDSEKLSGATKHLVGDNDFKFDGYELKVTFGEISPTQARIVVEYISDTEIVDGGKGIGPNYDINFLLPDGEYWWSGNTGAGLGDPMRREDGRWMCVYDFEAVELYTQPDALIMEFSTYPIKDGEVDLSNPITHEADRVILRFE